WVGGSYAATFAYDPAGQMTGASDPFSVYTYSYDADGRTSSAAVSYPGSGLAVVTLSYFYDQYGNRTSMSDSGAGFSYSYNANNQLTAIYLNSAMTLVTQAYDSQNRLSTVTMSWSGVGQTHHTFTSTYSYDTSNRVTGITYKDTTAATTLAVFS